MRSRISGKEFWTSSMGLDYTEGCVNFRDVGEFINLILEEKKLPQGRIYRGGSIDYVKELTEINTPKSIINLRNRPDFGVFEAEYFHFPMTNKLEKYDTSQKEVRKWLNQILRAFENPQLEYPVLIHCLSGKDRTGIVVVALLLLLGIGKEAIRQEYLLSEGEVREDWINLALEGMGDVEEYFNRVDLEKVRKNLLEDN